MSGYVYPLELCLESLDPHSDTRPYVHCVAVARGTPGLGIGPQGEIVWCENARAVASLWISSDGQLMVSQAYDRAKVELTQGCLSTPVPKDKPTVILNEDVLTIEGHAFRVHICSRTNAVIAPEHLSLRRNQIFVTAGAMAALAISG